MKGSLPMMTFRQFCEEIRQCRDIRVMCNDWSALENAIEDYVRDEVVADKEEAAKEILGVSDP
jgi:hypothetical protein